MTARLNPARTDLTRLPLSNAAILDGALALETPPEALGPLVDRTGTRLPAAPTRTLRIAVIGGRGVPSHYSGIEQIWEKLYGLLASRGHHITVYCRPGVCEDDVVFHGMRRVTTSAPVGGPLQTISHSYTALRHACRRGDVHDGGKPFDLITLHALPPQIWASMPSKYGIPLCSHVHGLDWQRARWQNTPMGSGSKLIKRGERAMVKHADGIAVCADGLAGYYQHTYGVETTVIHNGVLPELNPPALDGATLMRFGLTPGKFIVSIGRLVPEKRLQDTIAAFDRLGMSGYKLAIVGDGSDRARLEKLAGPGVVFTGQQQGDALQTLFRGAAAYVTASELEGLPSSVLEAMERCVPVVASNIAPHRSLLDRVSGYDAFFPVGDVEALSRVLRRVLGDKPQARAMADAQQATVRQYFSWQVLTRRAEQYYLGLVEQHGKGRA